MQISVLIEKGAVSGFPEPEEKLDNEKVHNLFEFDRRGADMMMGCDWLEALGRGFNR